MAGRHEEVVRCSFCNKTQAQVGKMIAGPNGVYICDQCVDVCVEIIEEEMGYMEEDHGFEDINLIINCDIRNLSILMLDEIFIINPP